MAPFYVVSLPHYNISHWIALIPVQIRFCSLYRHLRFVSPPRIIVQNATNGCEYYERKYQHLTRQRSLIGIKL